MQLIKKIKNNYRKMFIALNLRFNFTEFSLPDFWIIGAQKSGTTSLYSYLVQHPAIIAARKKEIFFFSNPHKWKLGRDWYASHFCTVSYKKKLAKRVGCTPLTGEASPSMHRPFVPGFAHQVLPSAKLIAILRDPVERAYSQYQHNRRFNNETRSFKEVIDKSPLTLPPHISNDQWLYFNSSYESYLTRGLYVEHIERWSTYYQTNQIHIINSNDLFAEPVAELNKVVSFLGLPEFEFEITRAKNAGNYRDNMDEEIREYLVSLFRPYNRKLFDLIGRDFGWPS